MTVAVAHAAAEDDHRVVEQRPPRRPLAACILSRNSSASRRDAGRSLLLRLDETILRSPARTKMCTRPRCPFSPCAMPAASKTNCVRWTCFSGPREVARGEAVQYQPHLPQQSRFPTTALQTTDPRCSRILGPLSCGELTFLTAPCHQRIHVRPLACRAWSPGLSAETFRSGDFSKLNGAPDGNHCGSATEFE